MLPAKTKQKLKWQVLLPLFAQRHQNNTEIYLNINLNQLKGENNERLTELKTHIFLKLSVTFKEYYTLHL